MYEHGKGIIIFNIYCYLRTFKTAFSILDNASLEGLFFHLLFLFNTKSIIFLLSYQNKIYLLCNTIRIIILWEKVTGKAASRGPPLDAFLTWREGLAACGLWLPGLFPLALLQRSATLVI